MKMHSRVGLCALSAAWTGSCQVDEKNFLRYTVRIPLLHMTGSLCPLLYAAYFAYKGGIRKCQNCCSPFARHLRI